jgi:hypothetical protein
MVRATWSKPARRAFETKVEILEGWVKAGALPDDAPQLSTINDVRLWDDPGRGLTSWSSYSVAAPGGAHADLRARLDFVLPQFVALKAGAVKTNRKPRRGKAISQKQVEAERNKLAEQNVVLIAQNHELNSDVIRIKQLVSELEEKNRILIAERRKLVPFGRS